MQRAAVEQEFFRQGGFPGIGMRYYGEGAAARYFTSRDVYTGNIGNVGRSGHCISFSV